MRQLMIYAGAVALLSLGTACGYLGDLDEASYQEPSAPDLGEDGRGDIGDQVPNVLEMVDDDKLDAGEDGGADLRVPLDVDDGRRGDLPPLAPRDAQEPPEDVPPQGRDAQFPPDDVDFPPTEDEAEVINNGRDLQG